MPHITHAACFFVPNSNPAGPLLVVSTWAWGEFCVEFPFGRIAYIASGYQFVLGELLPQTPPT